MTDSSNGFRSLRDRLVVDQLVDRLPRRQGRQARDLVGRGAEAGALDEMRGALGAPVARGDRRQIAGPRVGAGGAGISGWHSSRGRAQCNHEEEGQPGSSHPTSATASSAGPAKAGRPVRSTTVPEESLIIPVRE